MKTLITIILVLTLSGCATNQIKQENQMMKGLLLNLLGEMQCYGDQFGKDTLKKYGLQSNLKCPPKLEEKKEAKKECEEGMSCE